MARHMRNGRDYSRPGPKVDYELRKDSNNAARSGEVYDKIEGIQSQIVPTASIENGETASKAYNIGDLLVKNGALYKVTNAIAKDDALTVGTNIELDTVGGELIEISERLSQYKIKEYTFEYTKVGSWVEYEYEEINAFIDANSYIISKNVGRIPLNYGDRNLCYINNKDSANTIKMYSSYAGTAHVFIRYN